MASRPSGRQHASPAKQNKETVRRLYQEVWNKWNVDFAYEVFAEDYVRHDLGIAEAIPGPEGQRKIAADFRAAFPDLRWDVDILLAEGDLVAGRWTARGTNTGSSWAGVEPTGKTAEFSSVNIFRFGNGKVVEIWNHRDDLGLREQLGAPIFAGSSG